MVFGLVLATPVVFSQVSKEEVLQKIAERYQNVQELKVDMEMGMLMMGGTMKIPCTIWKKDRKMRMDMLMQQPGMPAPMEQKMVFDDQGMVIYQKAANLVMKFDFSKMPGEAREQVKKQQAFFQMDEFTRDLNALGEKTELNEATREGKKFYVFEIKDLAELAKDLPLLQKQQGQFFKRMKFWIEPDSYCVSRLEFFAETEQPGMWMDFKNYSVGPVPTSVFSLDIPKDAKVMDMTEMVTKMMEGMKQPAGAQTQ